MLTEVLVGQVLLDAIRVELDPSSHRYRFRLPVHLLNDREEPSNLYLLVEVVI